MSRRRKKGKEKPRAREREKVKFDTICKAINIIALIALILTLIATILFLTGIPWNEMLKM